LFIDETDRTEPEMQLYRSELGVLALLGSAIPFGVQAVDIETSYPQRPLTLVVGYPPGGSADGLARLVAKQMADELGHKVIIDYRPGAAGNIGAEAVARTSPDGYTMYLAGRPNTIHKVMYPDVKYDFTQDLAPIGLIATAPYVMVVDKHAPAASVEDIVSLAKAYPGGLTCASSGTGTTEHLLCELLQQETGIDLVHVPYRGSSAAFTDVMGGRVDIYITSLSAVLPHITAGNVRAVAMMSSQRVPALPQVPTIGEAGLPSLALGVWYGLMAPAGTPPYVVTRLNQTINSVLLDPSLREALTQRSYAVPSPPNTPDTLQHMIAEETERWTAVLRDRNIQALH
jgi:tripartite-type tricarboxylate transporter receptor subunit TctC